MAKLTDKERAALSSLTGRINGYYGVLRMSAAELGHRSGVLTSLVRKGFATSVTQTERPLHERAFSYQLYSPTEAGRQALTQEPEGHE